MMVMVMILLLELSVCFLLFRFVDALSAQRTRVVLFEPRHSTVLVVAVTARQLNHLVAFAIRLLAYRTLLALTKQVVFLIDKLPNRHSPHRFLGGWLRSSPGLWVHGLLPELPSIFTHTGCGISHIPGTEKVHENPHLGQIRALASAIGILLLLLLLPREEDELKHYRLLGRHCVSLRLRKL